MSSAAATATWQESPVIIWMSSIATTFAGSAMTTSRVWLVDVADRQRLVAARGAHREQVRRPHVDVVDGQVDVVEPVALGDRPGELVAVDQVALDEQLIRRAAGRARLLDDLVDAGLGSRNRARRRRR